MTDSPQILNAARFLGILQLLPCPERERTWRVIAPCRWHSARLDRVFTIPENLIVDLYSVPRPLWIIYPPSEGREDAAAGLHDYLVRYRRTLGLGLRACHREFYDAMNATGARPVEALLKWLNVWCFNWLHPGPGDGTPPASIRAIQAKWPVLDPPEPQQEPQEPGP